MPLTMTFTSTPSRTSSNRTLLMTIFFERVPTNLRGRIFGIANAMAWLVMPVGAVLAGALIEVVGLTATFALVAIAYLGVTLVAFVNPWLREMDDRPAGAIERPVEAVEASSSPS